jgi:hypothetical protein
MDQLPFHFLLLWVPQLHPRGQDTFPNYSPWSSLLLTVAELGWIPREQRNYLTWASKCENIRIWAWWTHESRYKRLIVSHHGDHFLSHSFLNSPKAYLLCLPPPHESEKDRDEVKKGVNIRHFCHKWKGRKIILHILWCLHFASSGKGKKNWKRDCQV